MHRSEKKVALVALAIMVIVVAACVLALCGCVPVEDVDAAMLPPEQTGQARELASEHASGMPLDAIEYDPPAWMPWCGRAYRVYDRTTGEQWWLLVMENQDMHGRRDVSYVVMPIDCQNA